MHKNPAYAETVLAKHPKLDVFQAQALEGVQARSVAALNRQPESVRAVARWEDAGFGWTANDALWSAGIATAALMLEPSSVADGGLNGQVTAIVSNVVGGVGIFLGSLFGGFVTRGEPPMNMAMLRSWGLAGVAATCLAYIGSPSWTMLASAAVTGTAAGLLLGTSSLIPQWARQRSWVKKHQAIAQEQLPYLTEALTNQTSAMTYIMGVESPQQLRSDVVQWAQQFLDAQSRAVHDAAEAMIPQWEQLERDAAVMQQPLTMGDSAAVIEQGVLSQVGGQAVRERFVALDAAYDQLQRQYARPLYRAQQRLNRTAAALDRLIADEAAVNEQLKVAQRYAGGFDEAALRAPLDERFTQLKTGLVHFLDTVPWYEPEQSLPVAAS